jgi:hypothetical protein
MSISQVGTQLGATQAELQDGVDLLRKLSSSSATTSARACATLVLRHRARALAVIAAEHGSPHIDSHEAGISGFLRWLLDQEAGYADEFLKRLSTAS